jgi:hypothetical protein
MAMDVDVLCFLLISFFSIGLLGVSAERKGVFFVGTILPLEFLFLLA